MRADLCKISISVVLKKKKGQLSLHHFHFFPYQELTNPQRNASFYVKTENQVCVAW